MEESSRIEDAVIRSLDSLKCRYEWIPVHPDYADTISFCNKYGYDLDHSGNTLLIISKRGEKKYSACIVKGSDKLDVNKKVKSLMEVKRLSFASPVETNGITGMIIGGVTPYGLPSSIPIYIDDKIMLLDYVILGAGSRSAKIKVASESLLKIPTATVVAGLSLD